MIKVKIFFFLKKDAIVYSVYNTIWSKNRKMITKNTEMPKLVSTDNHYFINVSR